MPVETIVVSKETKILSEEDREVIAAIGYPPSINDFGLSRNDVDILPKTLFNFDFYKGTKNYNRFIVYIFSSLFTFALIYNHGLNINFSYFFGFIAFNFIFAVPFLFAAALILSPLERKFYSSINSKFLEFYKYLDAHEVYSRRKLHYELQLAKEKLDYWRSLSGIAFERKLGELFSLMGYNVQFTPTTSDGGVDLYLQKDNVITVVQCKAHNKKIPIGTARELIASMRDFGANHGIIACFKGVTGPTEEYIKDKSITVLCLKDIIALQKEYNKKVIL